MRRAQRIVALHGEVVLLAIDWREAMERARRDEGTFSNAGVELDAVTARLDDLVGRLVDELERLAVPA
jgi:hypothetical protein